MSIETKHENTELERYPVPDPGHEEHVERWTDVDEAAGERVFRQVLLMLGAARHAVTGDRLVRTGEWDNWSPSFMVGKQVTGARLGIIGMGRVGRAFAAKARGFDMELIEVSPGEVAGIKSATVRVAGDYAYGWLRTETGVHRLVRKSPFDSGNRRHTSFAAVFVSPEVDDNVDVEINPADLRIDVYRASGAGGQHVNRTESAVRITHNPTGIVVQCQNDRSQHKNKATAMKQLKARLYEREMQERREQAQAVEDTKADIGWGSQIRSYVLDQSRIKDLRTGVEIGNTQSVLDGNIGPFIEASLKQGL